jgi:hypothetical protein
MKETDRKIRSEATGGGGNYRVTYKTTLHSFLYDVITVHITDMLKHVKVRRLQASSTVRQTFPNNGMRM